MKYRLDSITATDDGTGMVKFDIWAIGEDGDVIGGKHKDVLVPEDELDAALALPTKPEKISAIKTLLVQYAGTGWDDTALSQFIADNLNAQSTTDNLLILVGELPVEFSL